MEPLISVIIPIYNVEKYLRKCVGSVVNQTYKNLEIILIDDGSTDSCGKICDEYAEEDSRILVKHTNNQGPASARNIGIDICSGEYISFIDSDDFVSSQYIESLYSTMVEFNSDIVFTYEGESFNDTTLDENSVEFRTDVLKKMEISSVRALRLILYQKIPCGLVRRLYKRNLFNGLHGLEGYTYAEDLAVTYRVFMLAKKIIITNYDIYAVRRTANSLLRKESDVKKIISSIEISKKMFEDICNYNDNLRKAAASKAFSMNYEVFLRTCYNNSSLINQLWAEVKKYRKIVLSDLNYQVRFKNRVGAVVSFMGMKMSWIIGRKLTQK